MSSSQLLDKLRNEVERNLQNEQFGVVELAESAGMSRSTLHRKLQAATGQSISQFMREYRLERAMDILTKEDINITEVAFRVGFNSSSYFSKCFKELYGYPPVEANTKHDFQFTPSNPESRKTILPKSRKLIGGIVGVLLLLGILFFFSNRNSASSTLPDSGLALAILPFKNLNPDDSNAYFSDGVMEAILNKLSKVDQLRVTSRTSVEQFRHSNLPVSEIAAALNVGYILEGSAQMSDGQIQVIARLVDVSTNDQVWSEAYTRVFDNILVLQGEIAEQVVDALKIELSLDEQVALISPPTDNPEAYNNFLMAAFQHYRYTSSSMRDAISLYQEAIELDSQFVQPYINMADIWLVRGAAWGLSDQDSSWLQAKTLLQKALDLEPHNWFAHEMLGTGIFYYDWNFNLAEEYLEQAIDLNGIGGDYSTDFWLKTGALQKALELCHHYIEKNPLDSWNYFYKAEALLFMGKKAAAIQIADRAYRLFDDFLLERECVKLYLLAGATDRFISSYETLINKFSDRPPLLIWMGALHAHLTGQDLLPFIGHLESLYDQGASGSPAWFLALIYAALENESLLFEWLDRSFAAREVEMTWLKMEPALDPYKNDTRYLRLLGEMNFPDYSLKD